MGTLANSEGPNEIQYNTTFHQGLHCLLRFNQLSGTEIYYNFKTSNFDLLKYKMDKPIPIVLIYFGKALRMKKG